MKRDKPTFEAGDAEPRRPASGQRRPATPPKSKNFVDRAVARGHSGHGVESVRPHLRDQLRLKALMAQPFTVAPYASAVEEHCRGKDDHHR